MPTPSSPPPRIKTIGMMQPSAALITLLAPSPINSPMDFVQHVMLALAVLPMLGHASWHAYRDLVDATDLPAREGL